MSAITFERVRGTIDGALRHVRATDRYSRMRTAIVALWVALSIGTLFASCPASGPGNSLGAEFQVLSDSILGGEQLLIRNESDGVWRDVVLTLDGEWRYEQRLLRPREKIVVSPSKFTRAGERAPEGYLPRTLVVECDRGSHTFKIR